MIDDVEDSAGDCYLHGREIAMQVFKERMIHSCVAKLCTQMANVLLRGLPNGVSPTAGAERLRISGYGCSLSEPSIPLLGSHPIIEDEGGPISLLRGHTGPMYATLSSVAPQYTRRARLAVRCALKGQSQHAEGDGRRFLRLTT